MNRLRAIICEPCPERDAKRCRHLCQMFVGWRLNASKPTIVGLGSGTLEIDALIGQCTFQDEPIVGFPIAQELFAWMTKELSAQQIPARNLACTEGRRFSLLMFCGTQRQRKRFFPMEKSCAPRRCTSARVTAIVRWQQTRLSITPNCERFRSGRLDGRKLFQSPLPYTWSTRTYRTV